LNSPLHHSPSFSQAPIPGVVSTDIFSTYLLVYTVSAPYSPTFTISSPPPPSLWYQTPQDLFCPPVLRFCIRKEEKKEILIV
jgi:hypothetical protein